MTQPALAIRDLVHRFGGTLALDHVSLTVADGEFLTILGPSGSGKTTLLRLIGGFEEASAAAELSIGGVDMRGLPANHRPVATVFQHYALFPHMSVGENVEYGLKLRKVAAAERRQRAERSLALVRLPDKAGRRISQLSGGEKQRVAFARAFVTAPRILLLDEPMGALDEKLRRDMQVEVRALQRTLGTTFIQVTHSQEEALTMSDRIVVMNRGRIEQIGSPRDVFESPATRFVADFMGHRTIFAGEVIEIAGDAVVLAVGSHRFTGRWCGLAAPHIGARGFLALHPRAIRLEPSVGQGLLAGRVTAAIYKGTEVEVTVDTALGPVVATMAEAPADNLVSLVWRSEAAVIGPLGTDA